MFSVGYCGRPVEALSERISDQGSRCGMVPADPTMDIFQQLLPLFNGVQRCRIPVWLQL